MARGFGTTFGASNSDIITSRLGVLGALNSFSCWFYLAGLGASNAGRIVQSDAALNFNVIGQSGVIAITESFQGGVTPGQWTVPIPSLNAWHHIVFSYNSGSALNVPTVYIDGVLQSVTTVLTPSGVFDTGTYTMRYGNRAAADRCINGMLAHMAFWNTLLSAADMASLSKGVSPLLIQPQNLTSYLPLDGVNNPESDLINGTSNAITGTRLGISEPPVQNAVLTIPYIFSPTLISQTIACALAAAQQPNVGSLSLAEVIAAAIAANQVNAFSFISASEIIVTNVAAYQAANAGAMSLSELISAAIAAAQVNNAGVLTASEILAVAIAAAQSNNYGAIALDEIIGATLLATQQSNYGHLSSAQIIGALISAYQVPDFARIFPPPPPVLIGQVSLDTKIVDSVTLDDAALAAVSLNDTVHASVTLTDEPVP